MQHSPFYAFWAKKSRNMRFMHFYAFCIKVRALVISSSTCLFSAWRRWAAAFRRFAIAAGLGSRQPAVQISHVLLHAGDDLTRVFETHIESKINPADGFEVVLSRIQEHFKDQVNTSQAIFEQLNAKQDELDLDHFMQQLRDKITECEFCASCSSSLVATTFINDVGDRKLRRHLSALNKLLSPDEVLIKAKAFAATRKIEAQISRGCAAHGEGYSQQTASLDHIARQGSTHRDQRPHSKPPAHTSRGAPMCDMGCFQGGFSPEWPMPWPTNNMQQA